MEKPVELIRLSPSTKFPIRISTTNSFGILFFHFGNISFNFILYNSEYVNNADMGN